MQKTVVATATAAVTSTLLTLACCFPLGLLGAAGAMSAALFFNKIRVWLYVLSGLFLIVGFVQVARGSQCSLRSRRISIVVLALALAIVLLVAVFPQTIAAFLADYFPGGGE